MKGRNLFSKREVELIESLIQQRCNADSSQQKGIRNKMRKLGFYGSDYGVIDMTIEKFYGLIKSGEITISDSNDFNMTQDAIIVENKKVLPKQYQ